MTNHPNRNGNRMPADMLRPNPNPRLVLLLNYALDEILTRRELGRDEYSDWVRWATSWKSGQHFPQACVDAAQRSEVNVKNKINRGTFTAIFFVQCLEAIGCTTLRLEDN